MIAAAFLVAAIIFSYRSGTNLALVKFTSSGCFHYLESHLRVYKKNDKLFAQFKTEGKPIRETIIESSQLLSLNVFVKEIKDLDKKRMSTTLTTYHVAFNNEVFSIVDNGGRSAPFESLKQSLFGK